MTARVLARDGRTTILPDGGSLVLGRDPGCALPFPDEARLSRRAVRIGWSGTGVVISNLSSTHGLIVAVDGSVSRLAAGSCGGYVLTFGRAEISGPAWGSSSFAVTVVVDGAATADAGPVVLTTATHEPLRLRTETKEFLTALMLCRRRLLQPTSTTPPPAVPELTREILEATNSWHLLRQYDTDDQVRARLSGRVHEHLKALRVKIVRGGLAERGTRLSSAGMADLLVVANAVTRAHLRLFDDAEWLRRQEEQWWVS
ncbi:hypothetical protein [Actinomycetospora chiangmaiensis]|uniref:hypothetical protein n=1 Tax=Actinomycetospora chiangmaiensis TaxID=402650 RepID=UPI000361B929|nr:hypothetical protein [Actinomycetospora chiangmaiensis]